MQKDDILSQYKFSENAKAVINYAMEEAKNKDYPEFHSHHLISGIIRLGSGLAWQILVEHGTNVANLSKQLEQITAKQHAENTTQDTEPGKGVIPIIVLADAAATQDGTSIIGTEHILIGILDFKESTGARILENFGLNKPMVFKYLESIKSREQVIQKGEFKNPPDSAVEGGGQVELVLIRDHIKTMGLEVTDELDRIFPLAWHAQQHRSAQGKSRVLRETIVSRPTLLYALCQLNHELLSRLEITGFDFHGFTEEIGLGNFSPQEYTDPLDFKIDIALQRIFNSYRAKFRSRPQVDSLALAYGTLGFKRGRFAKTFEKFGGNFEKARTVIEKLISTKPAETPPESRIHSDKWTTQDKLNYELCAHSIYRFLTHKNTSAPLVVGIQAPWGQGKTSLMRMIQKRLDPGHYDFIKNKKTEKKNDDKKHVSYGELRAWLKNDDDLKIILREAIEQKTDESEDKKTKKTEEHRPTVWFNAWKFQSSEEIWAGLAHSVLSQLTQRLPNQYEREKFWLKLQLKRINTQAIRNDIYQTFLEYFLPKASIWLGIILVSIIVFIILIGTNMNASVIPLAAAIWGVFKSKGEWLAAKTDTLGKRLEGSYSRYVRQPDYSQKMGYLHLVEEDMKKVFDILIEPEKPLVIFIDDLDRCSPAKVGQVIEAVNLFMSGNYPDCLFVFGIDAQVVAASMEVVHKDIIAKLTDREDELGWRFMDKFIQLPFVIPRLASDQRIAFLEKFCLPQVSDTKTGKSTEPSEIVDQLQSKIQNREISPDEILNQVDENRDVLIKSEPEKVQQLQERAIDLFTAAFSDNDRRMLDEFNENIEFLSDNPRTIKRAINLYRFHSFMSYARKSSLMKPPSAEPDQITIWSIILIRWPHFVRWLQKNAHVTVSLDDEKSKENISYNIIDYIITRARDSITLDDWTDGLEKIGIVKQGWVKDRDLWKLLKNKIEGKSDLKEAPLYGLW